MHHILLPTPSESVNRKLLGLRLGRGSCFIAEITSCHQVRSDINARSKFFLCTHHLCFLALSFVVLLLQMHQTVFTGWKGKWMVVLVYGSDEVTA